MGGKSKKSKESVAEPSSNDETSNGDPTKKKPDSSSSSKSSALSRLFSLSTLSSLLAAFYIYATFTNLLNLMYPLRSLPKEYLDNLPSNRRVRPLWDDNRHELGLRVYLSSSPDFSLDFFRHDPLLADDTERGDEETSSSSSSLLLWSEDDSVEATEEFASRSFVLMGVDQLASERECQQDDEQSCLIDDESLKESVDFAEKWIQDAIRHEQQMESDGGGLMAAMNSAGGGIESTSVLLTFYTSLHKHALKALSSLRCLLPGCHDHHDHDHHGRDHHGSAADSTTLQQTQDEPLVRIPLLKRHPVWKSLMTNGTAYVHVLLHRQSSSSRSPRISSSPDARTASFRLQQAHARHDVLFGKVGMVKQALPNHVPSPKRLLYKDLLYFLHRFGCTLHIIANHDDLCHQQPPWNNTHHQPLTHFNYQMAKKHKMEGITYPYWKPEVRIHLIQDQEKYPLDYANYVGFDIVQINTRDSNNAAKHSSGYAYLPAVHVDEIGLTSDKYVPLNQTVNALPLRIGFHSGIVVRSQSQSQGITPARYRLLSHLSRSLESQADWGFEQSDIDDLRRLIAETNVMLLAVTILASVLHLLFEFLTFKSDVDFWRGNTDLTGLSVRALFLDLWSQIIILLYLIEMDSSLLMTIPTGVGCLIALWKCQRGAGFALVPINNNNNNSNNNNHHKTSSGILNRFLGVFGYQLRATRLHAASSKTSSNDNDANKTDSSPDLALLTEEMDQLATQLLGRYLLLPLVITYALYSLLFDHHATWYTWFITTASSFVYAVGFVLMTPQLFLNYKLKSVAHLPWRVLGYRFVNTFIDDLFAFIIRMPTMARMSCFRDDVVFFIYLWQRYLYPVDESRPVEGGGVGDVKVEAVKNTEDTNGKKN